MELAFSLLLSLVASPSASDGLKFTLRDHVGHDWRDELVHYPVSFSRGECGPGEVQILDEEGRRLPVQITEVELHPDGSVARAKVAFIVSLPAGATRSFTLQRGMKAEELQTDLSAVVEGRTMVLSTARIGVKVAWGEERYEEPRAAAGVPAPIQQFRLQSGAWTGKGWFESRHLCTRYSAKLTEDGPVYKQVLIRYDFQRPKGWGRQEDPFYAMRVRVVAGQEIATFTEEYNLGEASVYQLPRFESEAQEMLWDWWAWRPHAAPDNLCLSLTGAFQPTHARTIAHNVTSPDKGKGTGYYSEDEYALPIQGERFEFALNPWARGEPDQSMLYTLHRREVPDSDVVSIIPLHASRWLHPDMLPHDPAFIRQHTDTGDLRVYTAGGDVVVRAPLHLGRREWGLVTLRNPGMVTEEARDSASGTVLSRLTRKYGAWPLDKVKDWVLDWPLMAAHPHLFIQSGDLQGLRDRIKALPALEEALRAEIHVPVHRWLLDGREEDFESAWTELMQDLDAKIRQALTWPCGGERTGINAFPWHLQTAGAQADVLMGHAGLTGTRKKELLARLAFLNHVLWDGEYMPPRKTGYGWGSANMPVNVGGARGILAALLADHPRGKTWGEASAKYFGHVIRQYHGGDGSPLSCPHYMPTTGGPVVTVLLALEQSGLIRDPAKLYPQLHPFGRFLVDLTTPVDVRFGQRLLPTIGDSYWEGNPLSGQFAALFKESDPQLAGSLMWTWLQSGRPLAGFMNAAFFFEPRIEPRVPPLKSSVYPGFGAFLRHAAGSPEESYVSVRFGTFAADHMHLDAGSWHWYARGAPLSLDFASMYTPHTPDPWWHNTLSYNHAEHIEPVPCPGRGHRDCFYSGRSWFEHAIEPHTGWAAISDRDGASVTENAGRIEAFAAEPGADYVRGEAERKWFSKKPYFYREAGDPQPAAPFTEFERVKLQHPFRWVRQIAYVKGERTGTPEYMVVADDLSGNREVEPAFNFWCLAAGVKEEGRRYLFTGQHGIDLDMTVLEPRTGRVELREWGHKQAFLIGGNGLEENQKVARVFGKPDGGGFRMVLHPRKGDEPRPQVELLAGGKLARISFPGETHWVLLAREPVEASDGPVRVQGTAAVIKHQADGRSSLTLLAPGKIECAGAVLESATPASIER